MQQPTIRSPADLCIIITWATSFALLYLSFNRRQNVWDSFVSAATRTLKLDRVSEFIRIITIRARVFGRDDAQCRSRILAKLGRLQVVCVVWIFMSKVRGPLWGSWQHLSQLRRVLRRTVIKVDGGCAEILCKCISLLSPVNSRVVCTSLDQLDVYKRRVGVRRGIFLQVDLWVSWLGLKRNRPAQAKIKCMKQVISTGW